MAHLRVLRALADLHREEIVTYLSCERSVSEIVQKTKKSQPTVSLALRELFLAGIVTKRKDGRNAYYALRDKKLIQQIYQYGDIELFKALSDETRLAIVDFLFSGKKNVTQIVRKVRKSQPDTSLALKLMAFYGVVKRKRNGKQVEYSLSNKKQVQKLLAIIQNGK